MGCVNAVVEVGILTGNGGLHRALLFEIAVFGGRPWGSGVRVRAKFRRERGLPRKNGITGKLCLPQVRHLFTLLLGASISQ